MHLLLKKMQLLLLKEVILIGKKLLLKDLLIQPFSIHCVTVHMNKCKEITIIMEDQKESINPDSQNPTLKSNLWIEKYRNWAKKEHHNFYIKPPTANSAKKICWKKPKARMKRSHWC